MLGAGRFTTACLAAVGDPALRGIPLIGSVDQLTDSTDALTSADVVRRLRATYLDERT